MTLHQLSPEHFSRVQPLFSEQAKHHLFCGGVLAGKYTGQVIVDDLARPQSAMVFKAGMWCYLGGNPNNIAFNQALGEALSAKQFVGEDAWALLFNVPSDEWRKVLNTLIPNRRPIATPRYLYLANVNHFNPPPPIPDGFSLHFIDESLAAKVQGDLPESVREVLDLRATSQNQDEAAFGYVLLHDHACVSWAMVDCIVGTHGEVGLETEATYRRRGLGMVVSAETMRYGLAHGLTDIHWDVVSYNIPSVQMAEKHGLQLHFEYDQNLIIFNQMSYLANLAWDHLDKSEFEAVIDVCESLLALKNGQKYGYFLSGAAWAGLGQKEKALQQLNQSLDHGWDSLTEMEICTPLQVLHGTPEWEALISRVMSNMAAN